MKNCNFHNSKITTRLTQHNSDHNEGVIEVKGHRKRGLQIFINGANLIQVSNATPPFHYIIKADCCYKNFTIIMSLTVKRLIIQT